MGRRKLDPLVVHKMRKVGKTRKEIASELGVSEVAVWKCEKKLSQAITKDVVMEAGHRVVTSQLDTIGQLQKINEDANLILSGLMKQIKKGGHSVEETRKLREVALKASQEIRGQLTLQLEIFKTLTDVTAIGEFQKEVITKIGESNTCPECHSEDIICKRCGTKVNVRARIVQGLKEGRALRAGVMIKP